MRELRGRERGSRREGLSVGWACFSLPWSLIQEPVPLRDIWIFQSGCCSLGLGFLWLPRLLRLRTLHVWRADMGPLLRSGITTCLLLALAQVIVVNGQEDTKKGQWQLAKYDCCLGFDWCWQVYEQFSIKMSYKGFGSVSAVRCSFICGLLCFTKRHKLSVNSLLWSGFSVK